MSSASLHQLQSLASAAATKEEKSCMGDVMARWLPGLGLKSEGLSAKCPRFWVHQDQTDRIRESKRRLRAVSATRPSHVSTTDAILSTCQVGRAAACSCDVLVHYGPLASRAHTDVEATPAAFAL